MNDLVKIPAEAKEIIKHKRTGKVYASKDDFNSDVANPNTCLLYTSPSPRD